MHMYVFIINCLKQHLPPQHGISCWLIATSSYFFMLMLFIVESQ